MNTPVLLPLLLILSILTTNLSLVNAQGGCTSCPAIDDGNMNTLYLPAIPQN